MTHACRWSITRTLRCPPFPGVRSHWPMAVDVFHPFVVGSHRLALLAPDYHPPQQQTGGAGPQTGCRDQAWWPCGSLAANELGTWACPNSPPGSAGVVRDPEMSPTGCLSVDCPASATRRTFHEPSLGSLPLQRHFRSALSRINRAKAATCRSPAHSHPRVWPSAPLCYTRIATSHRLPVWVQPAYLRTNTRRTPS